MTDIQAKLDYLEAIANVFFGMAETYAIKGRLDESLKCTYLAACILTRQNRILYCERLESNLRHVAQRLEDWSAEEPVKFLRAGQKETCLHVFTTAHRAGGPVVMATRWARNDKSTRKHSVALLFQESPLPRDFENVFTDSGGKIYVAEPNASLVEKALWLRNLCKSEASLVILHVDPADVVCGAAFGVAGGPPVVMVNHTAHTFWTGASFVDLVVNCRGSLLERDWTVKYRGITRCATVPIPLPERLSPTLSDSHDSETRLIARASLDISEKAIIMVSVGAYHKYQPIDGCDFVSTLESILEKIPEGYLICVGFSADSRWRKCSDRLGGRVRCLGVLSQAELGTVLDAADIYLEAFPFGTTTALLEAGSKGIPVVLPPAVCPPPYASDGVALDDTVRRASSIEEYKTSIMRLIRDFHERARQSKAIRDSVSKHHSGAGWSSYLEAALEALPPEHSTYTLAPCPPTPVPLHEYWAMFADKWGVPFEDTLDNTLGHALILGLRPRFESEQRKEFDNNEVWMSFSCFRRWMYVVIFNYVVQIIPMPLAPPVYRAISFFIRPQIVSRLRRRLLQLFGKVESRPSWYAEYRTRRQ